MKVVRDDEARELTLVLTREEVGEVVYRHASRTQSNLLRELQKAEKAWGMEVEGGQATSTTTEG